MGGGIYVTHCNDTNHSLVKGKLGSLTALDMSNTDQKRIFFLSKVKLSLKTFPLEQNIFSIKKLSARGLTITGKD